MSDAGKLFIGRIPDTIHETDIEELFGKYGRISRVDLQQEAGRGYVYFGIKKY